MLPKVFTTNDIVFINIDSTNTTLNSIIIKSITQPSTFSNTLKSDYNYLTCNYVSVGCRVVRTYNQNSNTPDFTNYYDYNICVNALGLSTEELATNNGSIFGEGLTENTKYLIMLIASIVTLLLFTIIIAMFGDAAAGALVGLIMSMVVCLTLTLIFELTLLIPILFILIGGAIAAIIMRKIFAG
jgi:hypothetical protein